MATGIFNGTNLTGLRAEYELAQTFVSAEMDSIGAIKELSLNGKDLVNVQVEQTADNNASNEAQFVFQA